MLPSALVFWGLYVVSFYLVVSAEDWFGVWVGLELNMFGFILLVYERNKILNVESCLKYFFIQSLGSALFVSTLYFMQSYLEECLVMVLSMKMGAGPMFFWFPSVCEGLGWGACWMVMVIQKILPLMIIVIFIGWIVWLIVWTSLVIGVLGSFNQSSLSSLLAYSSVYHIGWMMVCGNGGGLVWFIYLIMYGVILSSVILKFKSCYLGSLHNVAKQKKGWSLAFSMFSLGGVPPMLGFFLKWFAFYYIMKNSIIMVCVMIIMSIVMLYVYVRVMYVILLDKGEEFSWSHIDKGVFSIFSLLSIVGMVLCWMIIFYVY